MDELTWLAERYRRTREPADGIAVWKAARPDVARLALLLSIQREDREDFIEEVLEDAILEIRKYKPGYRFFTFLFLRCRTFARRYRQLALRTNRVTSIERQRTVTPVLSVEEVALRKERLERIFACTRSLTERQREVLSLYLEDYSNKDIARILWITQGNVRVNLAEAFKRIRRVYSGTAVPSEKDPRRSTSGVTQS